MIRSARPTGSLVEDIGEHSMGPPHGPPPAPARSARVLVSGRETGWKLVMVSRGSPSAGGQDIPSVRLEVVRLAPRLARTRGRDRHVGGPEGSERHWVISVGGSGAWVVCAVPGLAVAVAPGVDAAVALPPSPRSRSGPGHGGAEIRRHDALVVHAGRRVRGEPDDRRGPFRRGPPERPGFW